MFKPFLLTVVTLTHLRHKGLKVPCVSKICILRVGKYSEKESINPLLV
jgi:hypothetical protein